MVCVCLFDLFSQVPEPSCGLCVFVYERASVWVCVGCEWVEVGVGAKLHEYVSVSLFVFSRVCVFMCNVHRLK